MPHDYSQFTDFLENKSQLDIQAHCLNAKIPIHVIHGENDTSVSPEEGKMIANWSKGSIEIIPGTAHTFGAKQPWLENKLPLALEQACESILIFFNNE